MSYNNTSYGNHSSRINESSTSGSYINRNAPQIVKIRHNGIGEHIIPKDIWIDYMLKLQTQNNVDAYLTRTSPSSYYSYRRTMPQPPDYDSDLTREFRNITENLNLLSNMYSSGSTPTRNSASTYTRGASAYTPPTTRLSRPADLSRNEQSTSYNTDNNSGSDSYYDEIIRGVRSRSQTRSNENIDTSSYTSSPLRTSNGNRNETDTNPPTVLGTTNNTPQQTNIVERNFTVTQEQGGENGERTIYRREFVLPINVSQGNIDVNSLTDILNEVTQDFINETAYNGLTPEVINSETDIIIHSNCSNSDSDSDITDSDEEEDNEDNNSDEECEGFICDECACKNRLEYDDVCSICKEEFKDFDVLRKTKNCNHVFHLVCLDSWLTINKKCPLCRTNINKNDDEETNNDETNEETNEVVNEIPNEEYRELPQRRNNVSFNI